MAYEGIEVTGSSTLGILQGFGDFKALPGKMLIEAGIGKPGLNGECLLDPTAWYPLSRIVDVMNGIEKKVGRNTLFQVGVSIASNVRLPPGERTLASVMRNLDIGYHLNHRKDGQVMFDVTTGTMLEGIGHFRVEAAAGPNGAICICDTVYPCDMNRGLMSGLLRGVAQASAMVKHDNTRPCRKTGGATCTFEISWL
jgi:hypothetical protein